MEDQLDDLTQHMVNSVLETADTLQGDSKEEFNFDIFGEALFNEIEGTPVPQV